MAHIKMAAEHRIGNVQQAAQKCQAKSLMGKHGDPFVV
jgi:hypothetical protein